MNVSRAEFAAIRAAALNRKTKRQAKAAVLWPQKTGPKMRLNEKEAVNMPVRLWPGKAPLALDSGPKRRNGAVVAKKKRKVGHLIKRSTLKAHIIRLLGLLDRKKRGNACRIHGDHPGFLAYHIVPAQRGDSTRFIPENVIWACAAANYGEVMNRSLYREKHVVLFGRELIERLEEKAHEIRKYSHRELLDLRAELKKELEAGNR